MALYLLAGWLLALVWFVPLQILVGHSQRRRQLDRCWGHCWEIVLYGDHPRPMLSALVDLWRALLGFLWLLRGPLVLWMIAALALFSWVEPRAQRRCPGAGEEILVSVSGRSSEALKAPEGLSVSPSLWSPAEERTYWRVEPARVGRFPLQLGTAQAVLEVGPGTAPWSQSASLQVHYPQRTAWLGDYPVPWQVLFVLALLPWFFLGEWICSRLPGAAK